MVNCDDDDVGDEDLDIKSNGSGGHDDDERLAGEEREDQASNGLTKDGSHHTQLTSWKFFFIISHHMKFPTCVLIVKVSKCNRGEDASKVEEDGGRDCFLKDFCIICLNK